MKKTLTRVILPALLVAFAFGAWAWRGLSDFELQDADSTPLRFRAGHAELAGTLVLPRHRRAAPIALLVHGDGPRTRFDQDHYLPLVNSLLAAGIGVFSWDKAGVGDSGGDWLDQSMADRADETRAAWLRVREATAGAHPIGLLGFSQGGWVVPRVASAFRPAFSAIVGGAVSWRAQGMYYTRQRMEAQGADRAAIERRLRAEYADNDRLFGAAHAPADPRARPDIAPRRFRFITLNYAEDATSALATMQGPVLALWGAWDRNVDPIDEANAYRRAFAGHPDHLAEIAPGATHALLRARWFDYQLESDWPLWKQALFACLGRRAYEPGALARLTGWINAQAAPGAD
ncbi:alpha/beta hydrolase [Burkholderia sp. FERM BP-3421]|uniref:alpha/beta hydrolase family protein n=1 Tax=Burkholderia sp. FERM BP-3421 TaxID=1494466 RepID=UPI00235EEEAB|nr:alpha/beta hydrolase [Burkholderia sp. FERM BP-3421]WDD92610.1 alpha/beta hydrolase [Burkholderia sp. FERM BP-3421]